MSAAMEDSIWQELGGVKAENEELQRRLNHAEERLQAVVAVVTVVGGVMLSVAFTIAAGVVLWVINAGPSAASAGSAITSYCI